MIALDPQDAALHGALLESLIQWFSPWQTFFSHSKVAGPATVFVHLTGLLFGGGFAVAADRMVLRATTRSAPRFTPGSALGARADWDTLESLHTVHRPVIISLICIALSGIALATADIETFATSPVFWTKMGLVALLGINGLLLMRSETALRARYRDDGTEGTRSALANDRLWKRLRFTAFASMALWTVILLAGIILASG